MFESTEKAKYRRLADYLQHRHVEAGDNGAVLVTKGEAARDVFGRSRVPNPGSPDLKSISAAAPGATRHCRNKYRKEIITERGVGWWVTKDATQIVKDKMMPMASRQHRASATMELIGAIVNPGDLTETDREWFDETRAYLTQTAAHRQLSEKTIRDSD